MEQLLEPRTEKEQRHIRISGRNRLRLSRIIHVGLQQAILNI
jgi:hypothetical protein